MVPSPAEFGIAAARKSAALCQEKPNAFRRPRLATPTSQVLGQVVLNERFGRCYGGQMYPLPLGFLKHPTDSGSNSFGRYSTASGSSAVKAMVTRNTT